MSRKYNYILSNNGDNEKAKDMLLVQYKINDAIVVDSVDSIGDHADLYVSEDMALDEILNITKQISHKDINLRRYRILSNEEMKIWKQRLN